jgi:NADH-quinone oxidoreductase subunit J
MIRILCFVGLVGVLGVAVAPRAMAQPAAPAVRDGDTVVVPLASTCTPQILARVQSALPGAYNVTCHKTAVRVVEGQAVAGTVDAVHADVVQRGKLARYELRPDGQIIGRLDEHSDLVGSASKGMALLFWAFAAAAIAGALFVVTRRNLIAAVMGMVGSFLGIAAIYMMLYAQFLAVVQMLVYAGAIMVLFVFVVMILNRPEDEPVAPSGRGGQVLGGVAIVYLVGRLILMLMQVQPPNPEVAMSAPHGGEQCVAWAGGMCTQTEHYDWGSITAVGTDLFGPGLFPFEAISILLLIAVVGAIAVARPLHVEDDAPAKARSEGVA